MKAPLCSSSLFFFVTCVLLYFWTVFMTVLDYIKLRLRVGEVIPVKKRQNLKLLAEEEEDGEDVDAVVHSTCCAGI